MTMTDWNARFIALAAHIGAWSKDPSTKAGCVIIRPDRTIATVGYNGLPRGVVDDPERLASRPVKYAMTVHAEANALLAAREALGGCTAYVQPCPPCASCAALLIQAGVSRVVTVSPTDEQRERWAESWKHAATMFTEASVSYVALTPDTPEGEQSESERRFKSALWRAP